jgi:hypothetical protein
MRLIALGISVILFSSGVYAGNDWKFKPRSKMFVAPEPNERSESPYRVHWHFQPYQSSNWGQSGAQDKRQFNNSLYSYEMPAFSRAELRCERPARIITRVDGGSPKRVYVKNSEPICGYRIVPETVREYYEKLAPSYRYKGW